LGTVKTRMRMAIMQLRQIIWSNIHTPVSEH
jgi:hypothetical protein